MATTENPNLNDPMSYTFDLPEELIAHNPPAERGTSQLVVCRSPQESPGEVMRFDGILNEIQAGDLLVLNDTKVVPCRLFGVRSTGGRVEVFVLGGEDERAPYPWYVTPKEDEGLGLRVLIRPSRRLKLGEVLDLDGGEGRMQLQSREEDGVWRVRLFAQCPLGELLQAHGEMPLPPYIVKRRRSLETWDDANAQDEERYQTVVAQHHGAVAAPTAGLHFSQELLGQLQERGVDVATITLHVGIGTFRPLRDDESLDDQELHTEVYHISEEFEQALARTNARGGHVVAVGTTSTRALEDQGQRFGDRTAHAGSYETKIFIRPGYRWRTVDALVTNFHLPKSSLLVMIAAFLGYREVMDLYREAVHRKMRFYSYGDAMLLFRSNTRSRHGV